MNYDKIGLFIMSKRKEMGLTQKELADQLNLTDRAISRWERGIGCPDISTLEPLCQILHVSILEFLHGEMILENENQVVINLLTQEKRKIDWWKKISFFLLHILAFFSLCLLGFGYILPKRICDDPDRFLFSVVSPSMEPAFSVRDKVLIKQALFQSIEVGDIIAYSSNSNTINGYTLIHRVIQKKVDEDGKIILYTQGDNNDMVDESIVTEENFIGIFDYKFSYFSFLIPEKPISTFLAFWLFLGILSVVVIDIIQISPRIKYHF